jgi:addiction module RelB/DinJ family antitoxin
MSNTNSQNIVIRIDPQLNTKSKKILDRFGLTQSGYIKLMLTKLVNTQELSIDYSLNDNFRKPTVEEVKMFTRWEKEKEKADFKTHSFDDIKNLIQ